MTLPSQPARDRWAQLQVGAVVSAAALLLASCAGSPAGGQTGVSGGSGAELVIAEPVHSLGYLPLYVGIHEGLFEDEGLDVSTVTLQGGGAHTNAVLTGEAWAFIGGPEHNAFAAARDNAVVIKAVANVVNRGNVYLVARPGLEYDGGDLGAFLEGKTVVTGAVGGTPSSITQYLLAQNDLEPGTDVTVVESADPGAMLAIMKQGQADVAVTSEPILGQGVTEGIWQEPFYNVPQELGPYAYSTINVRQDSIDEAPETVQAFARAMVKSLRLVESDPELAVEVAHAEFPTLDEAILQETIDRSLEDELWEFSGEVTTEALETGLAVVRSAGVMDDADDPVQYDDIVDMSFIDAVED